MVGNPLVYFVRAGGAAESELLAELQRRLGSSDTEALWDQTIIMPALKRETDDDASSLK
jgi:hypothetical protein